MQKLVMTEIGLVLIIEKLMQEAGYKNGDPVDGEMFPTLYSSA